MLIIIATFVALLLGGNSIYIIQKIEILSLRLFVCSFFKDYKSKELFIFLI
jgi:hypothetical protein